MSEDRLEYLFRRMMNRQATPAEKEEFRLLESDPANEEKLKPLIKTVFTEKKEGVIFSAEKRDQVLRAVFQSEDQGEEPVIASKRALVRTMYRWLAAAAVILIAVSALTYFLIQNQKVTSTATAQISDVHDIAPGGNKAILTLGNGSKIILDSTHNGTIAQQGVTNIIKTDSGQLSYTVNGQRSTVNENSPTTFNTLSTPRGGQFQLTLPDGTKVWLNAASSITYPTAFNGKERKVTVTGEAYFEVVHKSAQPFTVSVAGTEVHDIGTHFNINAYPDEQSINISLLEGKVEVVRGNEQVNLMPDQAARVTNRIAIVQDANVSQAVAWKNGIFDFHDVSLEEAMRQLSRWYDIDVTYEKGIPDIEFGGSINRAVTLDHLLELLGGSGVHVRVGPNKKLIVFP